ncbi:1,4-alpha-glucan branching enzyme [Streptomyces flavidovirens]|uniref:1,4-alpha-glucan branching enzyme n=1 Tax=Streptomyces flavidovirens TaxID=67298 RepID=UPI000423017E
MTPRPPSRKSADSPSVPTSPESAPPVPPRKRAKPARAPKQADAVEPSQAPQGAPQPLKAAETPPPRKPSRAVKQAKPAKAAAKTGAAAQAAAAGPPDSAPKAAQDAESGKAAKATKPAKTARPAKSRRTTAQPTTPADQPPDSAPKAVQDTESTTPARRTRAPKREPDGPALRGSDRDRLLAGGHHDPHGLLGAHPADGAATGVVFRALRPFARAVTVLAAGHRTALHDDGDGLFSGVLPLDAVPPEYSLLVTYDDNELEVQDPYRFLPALGELDLYLIGEGRHEELWRALGAQPMVHQGVSGTRFTVWAPNARGVRVAGDFNYWNATGFPMRSLGSSGIWELFVPGVGEGTLYKFEIMRPDGSHTLRADPMARRTECPPANASIVTASHHVWRDQEWMEHRADRPVHKAPFSVYEVHLGSWRPGLSYRELAEQLPAYVADLGFTHVELMPVAEHPFGGSWGYQVTGLYAPTARMGTPDDFRYLVESLHRAGIGVIMDWVPAHFPKDDWALARFDGPNLYEHEDWRRAEHPDWGTLEFDYGRPEVRNFLVANATYWCEEFHIDGLRVDAVASMLYLDYSREHGEWAPNEFGGRDNPDAVSFLQEMNATVYRRNPGVVTIAEESTAWDGVTRPTDSGGLGFGLKWNMGWMHDSLVYVSKEPVHRKYHHNEMTFSMVYAYSENYVLPISHDEVVHGKQALVSKMPGDWWQQRANHRAYLGYMWAHPGKQLLFMGQEFAQGAEWSEGHGPDWWLLDPSYSAEPDHRGVRDLVRDLNQVYLDTPALWELDTVPDGFAWVLGDAAEDNVFAFLRFDAKSGPLLAVSNFSPVVRHGYRLCVPDLIPAWTEVLNTDAARYGGSDVRNPEPLKPEAGGAHGGRPYLEMTLPPLATVWFKPA